MARKSKLTDQQIAEELTALAMEQLKDLPPSEREARIAEFGRRVSNARASRSARATSSGTSRTRPTRARARVR